MSNKKSKSYSLVPASFVLGVIVFLGALGWGMNIMKLIGLDFSTINGEIVVRIIGIFVAPIGSIYGFF